MLSSRRIGPLSSGIAFTLPIFRAFSSARHGTNPTPRPASTAEMMPSVEFMSTVVRSCCRKTPFRSRYSSTKRRIPDPTSLSRIGSWTSSAAFNTGFFAQRWSGRTMSVSSSSSNTSIFKSGRNAGASISPAPILCEVKACRTSFVLPPIT